MRAFLLLCVLVLVGVSVTGYMRGWFNVTSVPHDGKRDLTVTVDEDKIRKDRDQIAGKFHELRGDFRERANGELSELERRLDELRTQAKSATGETRDRWNQTINELNTKLQTARSEFKELESAADDQYDRIKTRVNVKIAEVKEGFEKAKEQGL